LGKCASVEKNESPLYKPPNCRARTLHGRCGGLVGSPGEHENAVEG